MKKWIIIIPLVTATLLTAGSGKSIYKKECAACHGSKGEKKALGVSHPLHGMPAKKLIALTHDYASGKKKGHPLAKSVKKRFIKKYNDNEIKSVADYIGKL
ncbi:c-type cytochrome [Sulfurovum sp. ST-21]|uniref:C-type cytochrome n=1 Tax=Sulfurovum indicum TaxID=2779528 RepID=A0A7M1S657_9BACT|nr:c-type cytochrome [Sulfurovum indicum]QOR62848.1 c-type cytochrome [Sulfurovum indicum]